MTIFLFWFGLPQALVFRIFLLPFHIANSANLVSPRCFKKRYATFFLEGALAVVQVVVGACGFAIILFLGRAAALPVLSSCERT